MNDDATLIGLAEAAGLSIDWTDANGQAQRVTPEVLRPLLESLGFAVANPAQVQDSLKRLQGEAQQASDLPPLLVVDAGEAHDLAGHFAAGTPFRLTLEDGREIDARLDAEGRLPPLADIGYQRLAIGDRQLNLAVAPTRCIGIDDLTGEAGSRLWGLSAQFYSVRRTGDGGFGDTQGVESLARAAAGRGADALAISPLHAMFSADLERYSPYSPSSRMFFNILHASPGSVLGEQAVGRALESCGLEAEQARLEALELIDWPAASAIKLRVLRALFEDFTQGGNPLMQDFEAFRAKGGDALTQHCRFEALHTIRARDGAPSGWQDWPQALHDPEGAEVARFADEHSHEVSFHAFGQWLIARGLERVQVAARSGGMRIGLIADLAVGADGSGSQAWSRQAELLPTLSVGAPPDILNRAGQSWGVSAFSPTGLRRHGYRAYIEMLQANLAHAGGIRIDHVMGLQRLWVIPQGAPPQAGAYLNYPVEDLLRLLALESHRHQAIVLGEDLGTVPEGFHERIARRGVLGMRVLQFEQRHGRFLPPGQWPSDALATPTTHDLPTMRGWWKGVDIDWREKLGQSDAEQSRRDREDRARDRQALLQSFEDNGQPRPAEDADAEIVDQSLRFLGETPAPLVLLPLEDVLGLSEQPNLPGTVEGHPNWCRRLPGEAAELLDEAAASRRLELIEHARRKAAQ
ncbi:4-alpha-glucanotransferase [Pseudomonas sp. RIT-PI-AD]|uniref:4-alpha-glucanotransferase n=1 Tax=Pseudomonas sp. RIT-PI-AD TaxID=3035294 RepID=UPI0021DA19C4|nr:4-alpha-glucanotransferase [Pseudomonas sp. RIT-PI-AD]